MVTLFTDPRMADHVPPRGHPERPERLEAILRHLARTGIDRSCPAGTVREATDEEILRVHTPEHLALVERFAGRSGGQIEADTWMSPGSPDWRRGWRRGAAIGAVDSVVQGPDHRAACLVRPPGHHAIKEGPMGFCLFGNAALAAARAFAAHGMDRVLVVDFDVHHGNGTQDLFYDDPRLGFLSIHRYPFYPGTGLRADETGTGRGRSGLSSKTFPCPMAPRGPDYHEPPSTNGLSRAGRPDAARPSPSSAEARGSTPMPRTPSATSAWRWRTSWT